MIKALRITVSGCIPYEYPTIYDLSDQVRLGIRNLFEDSQIAFETKEGLYILPDYNVLHVHLSKAAGQPPPEALKVKRILLAYDLNYQDCYIIEPRHYDKYGIPVIFRPFEQLAFICKDGLFITPDFQVNIIQVK